MSVRASSLSRSMAQQFTEHGRRLQVKQFTSSQAPLRRRRQVLPVHPGYQPLRLLGTHLPACRVGLRPDELAAVQSAQAHPDAGAVPAHQLEAGTAAIGKHIGRAVARRAPQRQLRAGCVLAGIELMHMMRKSQVAIDGADTPCSPTSFMRWQDRSVQFEGRCSCSGKAHHLDQQRDRTFRPTYFAISSFFIMSSLSIGFPFFLISISWCIISISLISTIPVLFFFILSYIIS